MRNLGGASAWQHSAACSAQHRTVSGTDQMWWLKSLRCFTVPFTASLRRDQRPQNASVRRVGAAAACPRTRWLPPAGSARALPALPSRSGEQSCLSRAHVCWQAQVARAPARALTRARSCQTPAHKTRRAAMVASASAPWQQRAARRTPWTCPTGAAFSSPRPAAHTHAWCASACAPGAARRARRHACMSRRVKSTPTP